MIDLLFVFIDPKVIIFIDGRLINLKVNIFIDGRLITFLKKHT